MNLPDSNFLSAPLELITLLHIITLTLHFVAMNFMFGGLVVILFGRMNDKWNNPVTQKFIKLFPSAMAATVTLGVAPLLFVQVVYPQQIYSAAIISGWFWMGIVGIAIIAYYFLYAAAFSKDTLPGKRPLYLSIALGGFVYISFVYSSTFSMAENSELMHRLYGESQSGLTLNPEIGSYILRWLHMLTGAVTVGSFFVGLLGKNNEPAFQLGKQFYLWGMACAAFIGMAYMFTFGEMLLPFMRTTAIWHLMGSIILSAGSLHFFFKKRFVPAGLMLFVSMLGMVTIRHTVRLLRMQGTFDPASIPVNPQWSVFAIFILFFVLAIVSIWYMLRLYLKDRPAN